MDTNKRLVQTKKDNTMTNALELLKAAATNNANIGNKTAVEVFIGKIAQQIEYATEVKEGKRENNTRSLWFKKNGATFIVRIGRTAMEIAGAKAFTANNIDGVIAILNAATTEIQRDTKLQEAITRTANERSTRLKAGRAAKKSDTK